VNMTRGVTTVDLLCLLLCLHRLKDMQAKWQYDGDSTCAADGMCAVRAVGWLVHS
jgi:hypothetical protein